MIGAQDHSAQQEIVEVAREQIGKPYVYGTQGPNTFDCSGLIYWIYKKIGHPIRRLTAYLLSKIGRPVHGPLKRGDIIVVDGGQHVVLYVGGGKVIHAPHAGSNVQYAPVSGYLRRAYAVRRVLMTKKTYEPDPKPVKKPKKSKK
jgi:cell wall-associated NlpC family hydrolase